MTGWQTAQEWADRWGLSLRAARRDLRLLTENGWFQTRGGRWPGARREWRPVQP